MLLEVEQEIFTDQRDLLNSIYDLVRFVVDGRHTWYPPPDAVPVINDYLQRHVPSKAAWRELLTSASKAAAWQTGQAKPVRVTAADVVEMVAELGLPAVVVVENLRNDGSFLRAVFAAYDSRILAAYDARWLDIVHSGGTGEQPFLVERAAGRFRHVCRVLVVKDNDNQEAVAEDTDWDRQRPTWHMWRRHEVENYLPDAVLKLSDHPAAAELLRHLRQMTPEQQSWIDMKHGLNKSRGDLFASLGDEVRRVWRSGYGSKGLPRPLVPTDLALTVEDFRALGDDVDDELRQLMGKISRIL